MPSVRGLPPSAMASDGTRFEPFTGYDNDVVERAGVFPLAMYSDGNVRFAFPRITGLPGFEEAQDTIAQYGTPTAEQNPEAVNALAMQANEAAGGAMTSGIAAGMAAPVRNAAGVVRDHAIARAKDWRHFEDSSAYDGLPMPYSEDVLTSPTMGMPRHEAAMKKHNQEVQDWYGVRTEEGVPEPEFPRLPLAPMDVRAVGKGTIERPLNDPTGYAAAINRQKDISRRYSSPEDYAWSNLGWSVEDGGRVDSGGFGIGQRLRQSVFGKGQQQSVDPAEMAALQQRHTELFGKPYITPQPPGGATAESMAADLAELRGRIASREQQNAQPGPSVPQVQQAIRPQPNPAQAGRRLAEREQIVDQVEANPYVQTRGVGGKFVKKDEEKRLVREYYHRRGEPLPENPWSGRDPQQYQEVAKMQQQFEAARNGVVTTNSQIAKLEGQRATAAHARNGSELKRVQAELEAAQKQLEDYRSMYERLRKLIPDE